MLKLIDDVKGEGDTAQAAKALLQERYIMQSSEVRSGEDGSDEGYMINSSFAARFARRTSPY